MKKTPPPGNLPPALGKLPVKRGRHHVRNLVILVVISVVLLGLLTLVTGAYTAQWRAPVVKALTRVVPIPAVVVNGQWRSYYDFLDAVDTIEYAYSNPDVLRASGFTKKPTRQELELLTIDRLVKDEVVRQLADRRGVVVLRQAVDAEMKKLVDQTGNSQEVEAKIKKLYGWDVPTFQRRVVVPFLIRQRLQEDIAMDDALNAEQRRRAEALLDRVRSGKEDFQAIAREVNEDVTKENDGDLGVFGRGERDVVLEEAAFALNQGETSEIVRTNEGFHILKILEKVAADEKTGEGDKVHVAHVFISAKPLDLWLFEQSRTQRVAILLTGYSWDKANARVIVRGANANAAPQSGR